MRPDVGGRDEISDGTGGNAPVHLLTSTGAPSSSTTVST
jgi:hypothetical protein